LNKLSISQHSLITAACGSLGASHHSLDSIATSSSVHSENSVEVHGTNDEVISGATKKVSFRPRIKVHRVPNRSSMLRATRSRIWYDREEFRSIRQECFETIRAMQEGYVVSEEDGFCRLSRIQDKE